MDNSISTSKLEKVYHDYHLILIFIYKCKNTLIKHLKGKHKMSNKKNKINNAEIKTRVVIFRSSQ